MAGELVFITGGSGHVGYRIIVEALQRGYKVRAAVRSDSKANAIKAGPSVQPYLNNLEFTIVPDILTDGAFDKVLDNVTYIIHAASPIVSSNQIQDYDKDLIQPAIKGTTGILKSAAKLSTVKRVVITSSMVAIIPANILFAEESHQVIKATDSIPPPLGPYSAPFEAYAASKALARHASDDFVSIQKPSFDIINVMPSFVLGANELVTDAESIPDGTNGMAFRQILGVKNPAPMPGTTVHLHDVAFIHIAALDPKIKGGQGFIANSGGLKGTKWDDAFDIVKKHFPKEVENGIFPLGGEQLSKPMQIDASNTEETFGFKFKNFEEQVVSIGSQYAKILGKSKA